MHGLLDAEAAEILALFDEWGETDRCHRKLAHRGSYLHRVWVSPSSVRRVLFLADKHFRPLPRPGRSQRKPFPDWADYKPNSIWIYDTTHFTRAGMAVLIIEDLVSRKWITEVVSVEETSTQVEVGFTDALDAEGLLEAVERRDDGLVDLGADDEARPILLAVSDNGPQMTSGSTREFMALCAIAQHFGRPGNADRSGLDRELQRAPQGRVPAPARHRRPGHPARRTGRHPRVLEFGPTACRHALVQLLEPDLPLKAQVRVNVDLEPAGLLVRPDPQNRVLGSCHGWRDHNRRATTGGAGSAGMRMTVSADAAA